jgi:hypothetical protein
MQRRAYFDFPRSADRVILYSIEYDGPWCAELGGRTRPPGASAQSDSSERAAASGVSKVVNK